MFVIKSAEGKERRESGDDNESTCPLLFLSLAIFLSSLELDSGISKRERGKERERERRKC